MLHEPPRSIPGQQWAPHPGPQTAFLASGAHEALFGGSAGGGKSETLVIGAMRYIHEPRYRALLLRRTFPELRESLWDRAHLYYAAAGGEPNESTHTWRFPSGARIRFGSLEHEHSKHRYQSDEYQFIGFDELTTFTEGQYIYLLSRLRSAQGIPCLMRAGTNPCDHGGEWVRKRYAPWLYAPGVRTDEYAGPYAAPGEVLWFARDESDIDAPCDPSDDGAMSRAFFPARMGDNPTLVEADPGYRSRLMQLDRGTRRRLLDGDWMDRDAPGEYFQRAWCLLVPRGPERTAVARVRWWDRAATEAKRGTSDRSGPDWTAGVLLAKDRVGVIYVEHVERFRAGPGEVERRIRTRAEQDRIDYGEGVRICLAKDPASAGKFEADHYVRHTLAGFAVRAIAETGAKLVRFRPFSAQAEHGNVRIVRGAWNEAYFAELEALPTGKLDQADATSGAYSQLERACQVGSRSAGPSEYRRAMGGF